jgi:hypothetical protein
MVGTRRSFKFLVTDVTSLLNPAILYIHEFRMLLRYSTCMLSDLSNIVWRANWSWWDPRPTGCWMIYPLPLLLTQPKRSAFPAGYPGMRRANPHSYDEYLKAYSMAMLPQKERENVSYGGKRTRHPLRSSWCLFLRSYSASICTRKPHESRS